MSYSYRPNGTFVVKINGEDIEMAAGMTNSERLLFEKYEKLKQNIKELVDVANDLLIHPEAWRPYTINQLLDDFMEVLNAEETNSIDIRRDEALKSRN